MGRNKIPWNKLSEESVINKIKDLGYETYGCFKYVNSKTRISIIDDEGYKYYATLESLVNGTKPRMVDKNNPYSIDNIKLYLKTNGYKVMLISDEYKNNKNPLEFICECGEHYVASWDKIKGGNKNCCRKCSYQKRADNYSFDTKDIIEYIKNSDIKSTLISTQYESIKDVLCFRCECGNLFYASFDKFKFRNKTRCNKCSGRTSIYCVELEKFLKGNNIEFDTEFTFDDCINPKTNKKLRFDYCVYKNDKMILIEVDGEHHFKINPRFQGEIGLKDTQFRDRVKNEYCKNNDIELIRLPYWLFNSKNEFQKYLMHIL